MNNNLTGFRKFLGMFDDFKRGWMRFAHVLGRINTTILLSIIYFIVIGIYAVFAKLGRGIMFLFRKNPDSYWILKKKQPDLESFKHPF